MYINRIILRDAYNFKELNITLRNDWTKEPLKSVLFTGPNGSGKSTLLRIIAELWNLLRYSSSLHRGEIVASPPILEKIGFAAIEICDFSDEITSSIWVCSIGDNIEGYDNDFSKPEDFTVMVRFEHNAKGIVPLIKSTMPLYQYINERLQRLQVGVEGADLLPNMVFIAAENRAVTEFVVGNSQGQLQTESFYKWLTTYDNHSSWQESLEGMIAHHRIRNPGEVDQIIEQANEFLVDKEIIGFDSNLNLNVQVGDIQHHITALSSGEKQALLLIFMVSRWLMPGGIVLIDEPDLHLHVSLQRQLIHTIEKIVHEKGGQLIITSHSPEMWDEFTDEQRINLKRETQNA